MKVENSLNSVQNPLVANAQSEDAKAKAAEAKMEDAVLEKATEMADESRASQGVGTNLNMTA